MYSAKDAEKFEKHISPGQKHQWASRANEVLFRTGDKKKALRSANASTQSAIERRLRQKNQINRTKGY